MKFNYESEQGTFYVEAQFEEYTEEGLKYKELKDFQVYKDDSDVTSELHGDLIYEIECKIMDGDL